MYQVRSNMIFMTCLVWLTYLVQNNAKPIMLRGPRSNLYVGQFLIYPVFFTHSILGTFRCLWCPFRSWDGRNDVYFGVPGKGTCRFCLSLWCIYHIIVIGE